MLKCVIVAGRLFLTDPDTDQALFDYNYYAGFEVWEGRFYAYRDVGVRSGGFNYSIPPQWQGLNTADLLNACINQAEFDATVGADTRSPVSDTKH